MKHVQYHRWDKKNKKCRNAIMPLSGYMQRVILCCFYSVCQQRLCNLMFWLFIKFVFATDTHIVFPLQKHLILLIKGLCTGCSRLDRTEIITFTAMMKSAKLPQTIKTLSDGEFPKTNYNNGVITTQGNPNLKKSTTTKPYCLRGFWHTKWGF